MKTITFAFAGFILFTTWAHAGETLDADAVKKLTTGNTVRGLRPDGSPQKIYFASDGQAYRHEGGAIVKSPWHVNDNGSQCISSMGECYNIVRNNDGTYDRVLPNGKVLQKWTSVVKGKDF